MLVVPVSYDAAAFIPDIMILSSMQIGIMVTGICWKDG